MAAPIAILIWLYVMSLAVLIGAALNSAVATLWPAVFGHGELTTSTTAVADHSEADDHSDRAERVDPGEPDQLGPASGRPAPLPPADPEAAAALARKRATDRAAAAASSPLEARLAAGLAAVPDTGRTPDRPESET